WRRTSSCGASTTTSGGAGWTRRRSSTMAEHRRSLFPASMGEHKGRHFCLDCTVSIDDFTAYVDWPCKYAEGEHHDIHVGHLSPATGSPPSDYGRASGP